MKILPLLAALACALVARESSAQVPVRFPEGSLHGFLELRTDKGALLAHGDLVQTVGPAGVESRLEFHFADTGTVFQESVRYTQDGAFALQEYHLVQRGDVFPFAIDATLSHTGAYVVRTTSKAKHATEKIYRGTLHLPADAANGLALIYAKNVSTSERTRVHIVAFTPEPRLIALDLEPQASPATHVGSVAEPTVEFTLAPRLGAALRLFATLSGKAPPDSHLWIATAGAPAFVRFEGPMYLGATWQMTLATPQPPGAEWTTAARVEDARRREVHREGEELLRVLLAGLDAFLRVHDGLLGGFLRLGAMAALVVLGLLQMLISRLQRGERGRHVRLILVLVPRESGRGGEESGSERDGGDLRSCFHGDAPSVGVRATLRRAAEVRRARRSGRLAGAPILARGGMERQIGPTATDDEPNERWSTIDEA